MEKKKFNVLLWDFNSDSLEHYDVLPYFRKEYKEYEKKVNDYYKPIKNKEDLKRFIKNESMYRFWSRCEYEMICHGWPVRKNDYKLDVHEQIMMNIDIIVDLLNEEFKIVK